MHNFAESIKLLQDHLPEYLKEHGIDISKPFKCPNPECGCNTAHYVPTKKRVICSTCKCEYDIVDMERLYTNELKVGVVTQNLFAKYHIDWINDKNIETQCSELNKDSAYREKELYFMRSELNLPIAAGFAKENGIDPSTLRKIEHIGVDSMQRVKDANGRKVYHPALIIPTTKDHTAYIAVDMITQREYRNSESIKDTIYGFKNLYDQDFDSKQCVFVVESIMDGLAIMEAGGKVISLESTTEAQVSTFLSVIGSKHPKHPLVLAFRDRTESDKACETIQAYCAETKIESYYFRDGTTINDVYGSPLAALKADRSAFISTVREFNFPQRHLYIEKTSGKNYVSLLEQYVDETRKHKPVTTGLVSLDAALGGGLRPYLYVIGGRTGSGKSALFIQIANEIAKNGVDIMYFTLEISRNEIVARMLSDIIKHKIDKGVLPHTCAVTENDILFGDSRDRLPSAALNAIKDAEAEFSAYSDHLFILESVIDTKVSEIIKAVDDHTKMMRRKPVVVVDYLQVLKKEDKYASDKESIDYNIHALKALAHAYMTPVVCLTSFNRASNSSSAAAESASSGSGQIEYTADIFASWQQRDHELSYEEWRKSRTDMRDMELFILKNRHGNAFTGLPMDYYPKYNYIIEDTSASASGSRKPARTADISKEDLAEETDDALVQAQSADDGTVNFDEADDADDLAEY